MATRQPEADAWIGRFPNLVSKCPGHKFSFFPFCFDPELQENLSVYLRPSGGLSADSTVLQFLWKLDRDRQKNETKNTNRLSHDFNDTCCWYFPLLIADIFPNSKLSKIVMPLLCDWALAPVFLHPRQDGRKYLETVYFMDQQLPISPFLN